MFAAVQRVMVGLRQSGWQPRRVPAGGTVKMFLWRYDWFRRLMTPTYQCPNCRRSYHYCDCDC